MVVPQAPSMESQNENLAGSDSKNSLRVWLYLLKCAKRLEQEMSDRFRENYNSSLSRFDVLAHLDLAGKQCLTTTQLASRLLASKGNISRLLDRMEKDGLIRRQDHPDDRRVSNICLSSAGAKLFNRMAPDHEMWSHQILSKLSLAEKDQLVDLLKSVKKMLDQLD